MKKVKIEDLDNSFTYISKADEWYKECADCELEANCGGAGGLFRGTVLVREDHGPKGYYGKPESRI